MFESKWRQECPSSSFLSLLPLSPLWPLASESLSGRQLMWEMLMLELPIPRYNCEYPSMICSIFIHFYTEWEYKPAVWIPRWSTVPRCEGGSLPGLRHQGRGPGRALRDRLREMLFPQTQNHLQSYSGLSLFSILA